jgi:hypothetical protein
MSSSLFIGWASQKRYSRKDVPQLSCIGRTRPSHVSKTPQAVEKVVVGPIGSPKQLQSTSKPVQNTTKPRFKALEWGSENNTREFFNTL